MNWFFILLMFLAFAMIIGPIMLMQPSKRQQKVARLRAKAAELGLKVSLQTWQGRSLAVYEKPWPRQDRQRFGGEEWALDKQPYEHEIHINGWWQWRDGKAPPEPVVPLLRESLLDLPQGVLAVEATRLGLRCYWTESGDEAALQQVTQWLDTTARAIWPYILWQETQPY